jgi:hypothetical protein
VSGTVNKVFVNATAREVVKIVPLTGRGPAVAGTEAGIAMTVATRETDVAQETTTMEAHTTDMACLPARGMAGKIRMAGTRVLMMTIATDFGTGRSRQIDMAVMQMATGAIVLVARQARIAGAETTVAGPVWML